MGFVCGTSAKRADIRTLYGMEPEMDELVPIRNNPYRVAVRGTHTDGPFRVISQSAREQVSRPQGRRWCTCGRGCDGSAPTRNSDDDDEDEDSDEEDESDYDEEEEDESDF